MIVIDRTAHDDRRPAACTSFEFGTSSYRLAVIGATEANRAERLALDTLDAYATAPIQDRNFADEPITRSVLALARISQGQVDGAREALAPVLDLPSSQRIHQIVTSVQRVHTALSALKDPGRDAVKLAGAIEGWAAARLPQPR